MLIKIQKIKNFQKKIVKTIIQRIVLKMIKQNQRKNNKIKIRNEI